MRPLSHASYAPVSKKGLTHVRWIISETFTLASESLVNKMITAVLVILMVSRMAIC